jgi:hypothetical protein
MKNGEGLSTSKESKQRDTPKKKYLPPTLTTYGKKEDLEELGKGQLAVLFEGEPTKSKRGKAV